jgi:GT2 family glycosyltransferase
VRQAKLPDEIIVVDQSENTLTRELVRSFEGLNKDLGMNFIWHYQKDKGSAKARNEGFRLSKGDIVCFTDDDIILDRDYLKNIVNYFSLHPEVGCIGGNVRVINVPKGLKGFARDLLSRIFLISFFDGKMTPSGFGFPIFLKEIDKPLQVDLIAGYSMNFRRGVFLKNQFDEWFTGYSFREDVELSYRVSLETKIFMIPDARFEHHHSRLNRIDPMGLKSMQFRNYHYIFNKHKNTSIMRGILFGYSILGILFIDLLEWLSGFKKNKWEFLKMDVVVINRLIKGDL